MGKYRTNFIVNISKKRTTLGWLFFVFVALLGNGGSKYILLGLPLILAGLVIRFVSAGVIKKNRVLTTTGPYSLCRNPLYLGSFLICLGFVVASFNIFILLYFLIFFPIAYIPTIFSEEKVLTEIFGQTYIDYKKQVPSFLPKLKGPKNIEMFSVKQALLNGEHWNLIGVAITIGILLIKANKIFYK
jgi:protein-S-isoprenylcysteine O-methyltransferase Ste14